MTATRAIRFEDHQRQDFYARVRDTPIDERKAADLAEQMARGWVRRLPTHHRLDLAACVVHKAAGYSADLHQYCRRALRAAAAADRWFTDHGLKPGERIDFHLNDLWLGEYFLLQRHAALGGSISSARPWPELIESLLKSCPPRCCSPGFESREIDIPSTSPASGRDIPPADVLFIATMDNYLIPMIPVMEELIEHALRPAVVLPAGADRWNRVRRIPGAVIRLCLEEIIPPSALGALRDRRIQSEQAWEHARPAIEPLLRVEGIDLSPLVLADLHRMAIDAVPDAVAWADAAESLVARSGARAVICARHRKGTEIAFSLGAQRAGAAVVMLIHGHISQAAERRFEDGSYELADAVCVWGPHQQAAVLGKATVQEPGRVVVTGNPAWDALRSSQRTDRRSQEARRRVAESLGLPETGPWIVLTTQEDSRSQFGDVARAVLDEPRTSLIIKTHPREHKDLYAHAAWFPGADRARLVCSDTPALHDLLLTADALVTFHSTTNVESLLLGTPVVTAAFGRLGQVDRLVCLETFGLPLARDPASLRALIAQVADDPARFRAQLRTSIEAAVRAVAGDGGGSAAARVRELIQRALSQRNHGQQRLATAT